jgi:hypothetical protein
VRAHLTLTAGQAAGRQKGLPSLARQQSGRSARRSTIVVRGGSMIVVREDGEQGSVLVVVVV